MPLFESARIDTTTDDLTEYQKFLGTLKPGQVVNLPLDTDENPRRVMRLLNTAAKKENLRLFRLDAGSDFIRFRVKPGEVRQRKGKAATADTPPTAETPVAAASNGTVKAVPKPSSGKRGGKRTSNGVSKAPVVNGTASVEGVPAEMEYAPDDSVVAPQATV